jgi:AraC-like DNA-binding protein
MQFYKQAIAIFLGLAALTALLAFICIKHFFANDAFFPAHESTIPWKFKTFTDAEKGGSSSVSITEDVYSLDYEYYLSEAIRFPNVLTVIAFAEPGRMENLVDLSKYSAATFRMKCTPRNMLTFYLHSFDEKVTDPADFYSYRRASALVPCDEEWSEVRIELLHLRVPMWWLELVKIDTYDQEYSLDKVLAISFDATRQGPVNTPAKVKIGEFTLRGHDWRYAWAFAGFAAAVWIGFISWLFRRYTAGLVAAVKNKLKKDQPLMAYQHLSIEPHRDREKNQLLQFMAAEYINPDVSLESAVATLGMNRTKINELLKDELGMTFSAYLNKLRLSEAARLLAAQDNANVEAIAHSVGYSDVSYFRKLFKNEYGCTPGAFVSGRRPERNE